VWEGGVAGEGFISGGALSSLGISRGTSDSIFHAIDWLPTLAEMAGGGGASPEAGKPLDGISQLGSLQGGDAARVEIFLGYSVDGSQGNGSEGAVGAYTAYRKNKFKLVRTPDGEYLLYNLKSDPEEFEDVAASHPTRVLNMKRQLLAIEEEFPAPILGNATCPDVTYGNTSWGELVWIPWCSV
jgi:arylsulfatase A-like enzyme